MANPIWKDYYITLPAAAARADFSVRLGSTTGDLIYKGRAHRRPDGSAITVRLNDICADWLSSPLPSLENAAFSALSLPQFWFVYSAVNDSGDPIIVTPFSVTFVPDWSYDYGHTDADGMAFPVTGRIQPGQWLPFTEAGASEVTVLLHGSNGTYTVIIPLARTADFNNDYDADFARSSAAAPEAGTVVLDPSRWPDVTSVEIAGAVYDIVQTCHRYALYYLNAYGGWDTLLMEGNFSQTDTLVRHTRAVDYDNRNPLNRGRRDFVNEITRALTLHTGWLSDSQAARMHHLLNSTDVYLHDLVEGIVYPVTVSGNTTEYKTARTSGGIVDYAVTVEIAHDMIRR